MITSSASNRSQCEVCGVLPEDQHRRWELARRTGARYQRARRNRTRIDPTYFTLACYGGRLDAYRAWAGKLVCEECYGQFSRALNP